MDDDSPNPAHISLAKEFTAQREVIESFAKSVGDLLSNLLRIDGVHHLPVETRAKEITSFEQKLQRPSKAGKYNRLFDMTDLAGIRIVVFYKKDVERVCNVIQSEFAVDRSNSMAIM